MWRSAITSVSLHKRRARHSDASTSSSVLVSVWLATHSIHFNKQATRQRPVFRLRLFDVVFGKVCYCVTTGLLYVFAYVRSALCRDAGIITCHHCMLNSGVLKCFCRGSTDVIWIVSFDMLSHHVIHVVLSYKMFWMNVITFLFFYYYCVFRVICCI
jgi:hypothetical protein